MTIKSFSIVTDYKIFNEIASKLKGAGGHKAGSVSGMFFRGQDLESSSKQLMGHLQAEHMIALRYADNGYGNDKFRDLAKRDGIRLYGRTANDGKSEFSTYDLGPALRHFLNDYCRVLEPLVKILALRHTTVSAQNARKPAETIPFNAYIKKLDGIGITTALDHEYFIKLYDELWNDYKHNESAGVQATGWSSDGRKLMSVPKLSSAKLVYFKDMQVDDFIEKSLDNMNALLDYIA